MSTNSLKAVNNSRRKGFKEDLEIQEEEEDKGVKEDLGQRLVNFSSAGPLQSILYTFCCSQMEEREFQDDDEDKRV